MKNSSRIVGGCEGPTKSETVVGGCWGYLDGCYRITTPRLETGFLPNLAHGDLVIQFGALIL